MTAAENDCSRFVLPCLAFGRWSAKGPLFTSPPAPLSEQDEELLSRSCGSVFGTFRSAGWRWVGKSLLPKWFGLSVLLLRVAKFNRMWTPSHGQAGLLQRLFLNRWIHLAVSSAGLMNSLQHQYLESRFIDLIIIYLDHTGSIKRISTGGVRWCGENVGVGLCTSYFRTGSELRHQRSFTLSCLIWGRLPPD